MEPSTGDGTARKRSSTDRAWSVCSAQVRPCRLSQWCPSGPREPGHVNENQMPISRRQLAVSFLAATDIAEQHAIAAFIADAATQSAPNPFPHTSARAVH